MPNGLTLQWAREDGIHLDFVPQDFSRLLSGRENRPQRYVNERVWLNPFYYLWTLKFEIYFTSHDMQ